MALNQIIIYIMVLFWLSLQSTESWTRPWGLERSWNRELVPSVLYAFPWWG